MNKISFFSFASFASIVKMNCIKMHFHVIKTAQYFSDNEEEKVVKIFCILFIYNIEEEIKIN